MSAGASITAVIPVHNRADLLAQLLDSLAAQSVPFARVIVVDNASTDGAAALAAGRGCTVISQSTNTGFARAVNTGWREARESEWIAILNSDVTLDPQWAERLRDAAADSSFATGTIFNAADRQSIDGTYDLLSRSGCAWRAGYGERPAAATTGHSSPIALAPGTACLFRRDVLEKLNGFDESFESYLEDVDLGLRCVREGYTGVYVPGAIAWHHGSATLGRWNARVVRLTSRNQLLLVRRHYDRELFRRCLWPIVAGQALWGLVAARHGAPFAWLAGKWDALRNFRLEGSPSPRLRAFLAASEKEIHARAADPYWRWYFRLTSSAGAAH
ncbi:MAG TPA: glycosyltransferase family 2 protein [Bryobacteraceae bacterium]|nr:glycosyltransferase family 2 protein [Bryobacteraceae bacterium]